MFRNLPHFKIDELVTHINRVWTTGYLPTEWNLAHVILLPKPGKSAVTPTNLRPIYMTLWIGKLTENMVLNRLDWHLEAGDHLPHTHIGFRRHVSTQDIVFRIQGDVFAHPSTTQLRT
ncbi:hypothetical protein HPB47_011174 [Ixodes persulcatus]|uniref:Uncharacterized protein n=1 Tax=Ixodes persulcatus TaxID=34615 RepID=A0AC60NX46_IXOPE|nr:hypothetical protein HPB47_011174 [Ixodes persulcatus]